MKYFMNKENVDNYIKMNQDYDPKVIVNILRTYLPDKSSILELGMGEGKDLDELSKYYNIIGSDNSQVFVENYNKSHTVKKAIHVDAIEMDIDEKFDCIYSNKVLQHLTRKDFEKSIYLQMKNLNPQGIVFMTLWKGKHREEMMFDDQIRFTYYDEEDILEIIQKNYNVIDIKTYTEMEEGDSLLIVLQVK